MVTFSRCMPDGNRRQWVGIGRRMEFGIAGVWAPRGQVVGSHYKYIAAMSQLIAGNVFKDDILRLAGFLL